MKFTSVARVGGLSAWVWLAAAAPDAALDSGFHAPGKPLEALIRDLADDKFQTREDASRKIWEVGEPALSALQETAAGKDPEQAYRARELIRKIQMHLTPDTDAVVMALVERYAKATPNEKIDLFDKMRKKRAWRQILKLYASENNPELQSRLQLSVEGIAIVAARECLLEGRTDAAREYLEMAPAHAAGLLALADFHRSQGTLDAELKRAKTLKGAHAEAWRLALYRAAGNLEAARDAATAAGEVKISATMSALLGDPVPWLRQNEGDAEGGANHQPVTELVIERWQGKAVRPVDLEPMLRAANSRNRSERQNGIHSLFLLGETSLAEEAYLKSSPLGAFAYFESIERIPEALKALGIDPEKPDYSAWVEKRFSRLTKDDAEGEHDVSMDIPELIALANFLERRGLPEPAAEAFLKPLAALAEKDAEKFTVFLGTLFGDSAAVRVQPNPAPPAAPQLAKRAALTWAGDNRERWQEVINSAFGEQDETMVLWDRLAELNPKASRGERLDGMLALCGMGSDPLRLRDKWLALAWESIRQTPVENRKPLLERMAFLVSLNGDVANNLKLWDQLPQSSRDEIFWQGHIMDLSAAERWDEAAAFFLKQIDGMSKSRQEPQLALHACAAASLRKAGRAAEASAQDDLVEKLALGNDALGIANGYAYGDDYPRAAEWWARAARQSDPASDEFGTAFLLHAKRLLEQGNWQEAASISEVLARLSASLDPNDASPLVTLRLRLQSDLGRALANLKNDRAGSIAILGNCHRMFPCDGSLADDFFPALRKMGLLKQHDAWFKVSWDRISDVIARFPGSDNTYNTAAWLASRALRNLDQAAEHEEKALAINPDQSAYLDTMAEIQFARGNRQKALEWSTRAVNFMPLDSQLRRQRERFRSGPLPR